MRATREHEVKSGEGDAGCLGFRDTVAHNLSHTCLGLAAGLVTCACVSWDEVGRDLGDLDSSIPVDVLPAPVCCLLCRVLTTQHV